MATLSHQVVPKTGLADAALTAASGGGDKAPTGAGVFLMLKNGDAAPHTVTLATPTSQVVDGNLQPANRALTVAAGKTGLLPIGDFFANPADNGLASWTYDGVTTVTVGVFRI